MQPPTRPTARTRRTLPFSENKTASSTAVFATTTIIKTQEEKKDAEIYPIAAPEPEYQEPADKH